MACCAWFLTCGAGFTPRSIRLFDAVAEIAGASLRRAVVLEALEKQVAIRTQHLSTLYRINAVASEPLELGDVLGQVLGITLEAMKSRAGVIHTLDEKGRELFLAAERDLPAAGRLRAGDFAGTARILEQSD